MTLTRIEHNFRQIAGALGIVQGLTYGILALICIILHNQEELEFDIDMSYIESVGATMYSFFLSPEDVPSLSELTLRPKIFTIFAWIYFFLHLFWLGVSIAVLFKSQPLFLTSWSHLTLVISLWDFITIVILGTDYNQCLKLADNGYDKLSIQEICTTTIISVLVIAARGFVLWFINIIFALFLNSLALRLKKETKTQHAPAFEPPRFPEEHPAAPTNPYNSSPQSYGHHLSPSYPSQNSPSYPQRQSPFYPAQPSPTYPTQPSPNFPPQAPVTPQNGRKNHFQYPVTIPQPDYHHYEPTRRH